MKKRTLTKAEKQNWKPLHKVASVRIHAKDIKGKRVIVSTVNSKRLIIA